ncbi:MAG: 2-hydroxyacid dehydrogenase [Luteolibacter sp.]
MILSFYDTKPYDKTYFEPEIQDNGMEIRYHDFRLSGTTASSAAGADAVCVFVNDCLDRVCLEILAAEGIKLVALRCAGFNNVDLASAREFGITVIRVPSYSPHAVAEHTVALLLALNRKIHRAYNRVREQNFSLNGLVGFDLYGKTIGIMGTGKIGRITAQIFRGFGCRVLAHDMLPDPEWAAEHGIEYTEPETLYEVSDVISLHLPLSPETHHMIDATVIRSMKHGAYLVNTSRGKLIDTVALIDALKSGHLGGAALDVYEEEEGIFFEDHSGSALQDDELARLMTFPSVLITSHQAFLTREALSEIARVTVGNCARFMKGEPLPAGFTV